MTTNHKDALPKALEALEACRDWHLGDKWRESQDAEQRGAWEDHMLKISNAVEALTALQQPDISTQSTDRVDVSINGGEIDMSAERNRWQELDFHYSDKDGIRTHHVTAFEYGLAITAPQDAQEPFAWHIAEESVFEGQAIRDELMTTNARQVESMARSGKYTITPLYAADQPAKKPLCNCGTHTQEACELAGSCKPADKPEDQFCDANCTWTNHHPDCVRADKPEGKAVQAVRDEVPERQNAELMAFVDEYVEAWDDGMAGDSYLYRMANAIKAKGKV